MEEESDSVAETWTPWEWADPRNCFTVAMAFLSRRRRAELMPADQTFCYVRREFDAGHYAANVALPGVKELQQSVPTAV